MRRQVEAARASVVALRTATTETKNLALEAMAAALASHTDAILEANRADLEAAEAAGTTGPLLDRLALDPERIAGMATGLRDVARLPDPVGQLEDEQIRPNGLRVARMRVPLGLVAMIYEARPGVTADAAALALKSGNAVVLRGGTEAHRSNRAIADALGEALETSGLPAAAVTLLEETDRAAILALVRLTGLVDLVIPRGGEGLIGFVTEHARVPVVQHYKGVCHVYVDAAANLQKAKAIVVNAKTQRPGVCNAMECLLVHRLVADDFLRVVGEALAAEGVSLHADPRALQYLEAIPHVRPATPADWGKEFLDRVAAVKVVDSVDDAIAHVARYGSNHTEAIVTEDRAAAQRWMREVDASCVLVNASTRFNDGAELGLGAEMGISTTKIHAYGPMGLEALTTRKFVVVGDGQVRS